MQNITFEKNIKVPLKRKVCIKIGLFLMKLYEPFRGCSGVKEHTEKRLKEFKQNKERVEFVDRKMPIVINEVSKLKERNIYLEGRVVSMFEEMKSIKLYADSNDCESIVKLLNKYNLDKRLEY